MDIIYVGYVVGFCLLSWILLWGSEHL